MKKKKVIIEFPNEDSAKSFLAWFSNSGEQYYFQGEEDQILEENGEDRKPIVRMNYSRAFPAWGYDPKKHGKDFVIKAEEK